MQSENNALWDEPPLLPLFYAGFFTQPRESQYCLIEIRQKSDDECTLAFDGVELDFVFSLCKMSVPGFSLSVFDRADWFVRWFHQEAHSFLGHTELTLTMLEPALDRTVPRLCSHEDCLTRQVYRFERTLPEREVSVVPDDGQPPLCLFGLDFAPDLYDFNQYRLAVGREVFRISFQYQLVFTYAMVDGKLMRCVGNNFESMVYVVIGRYDEDTRGTMRVEVMGMYE